MGMGKPGLKVLYFQSLARECLNSGIVPSRSILIPPSWIQYPAMKPGNTIHLILWAASALCSAQSITVRVYDYANLPSGQWTKTAADASLVLAKTGRTVTWLSCRGVGALPESAAICQSELGASDYVVRVLPGERNPAPGIKRALAYSQLDHGAGRYTTLFLDAIQAHASELMVSQSILLAYVTAHEVMHLLKGAAHSSSGLMKEYWTRRDAAAIAQLNLPVR